MIPQRSRNDGIPGNPRPSAEEARHARYQPHAKSSTFAGRLREVSVRVYISLSLGRSQARSLALTSSRATADSLADTTYSLEVGRDAVRQSRVRFPET